MRIIQALLAILALLAAGGCSRVSLVYNTADYFIEEYAEDYLETNNAQMSAWRPTLATALSRHRREELPYLAAFFDGFHQAVRVGLEPPAVECLVDDFQEIYRRHFRLGSDLAAPLLADLTPAQVDALERRFAEDAAEDAAKSGKRVERRKRKRAERWAESAEWWIGPPSQEQLAIIREQTAAMPDTAEAWVAYRSAKQAGLVRLLRSGAEEQEIRRYLGDWLADFSDLPPPLRDAGREMRERVAELLVRLDRTLSKSQRERFAHRLAELRDEFMDLQRRPRMADERCAGSE